VPVRENPLDRALPRPAAEPAAAQEGFERGVDLEGVARARIEEALDARGDVRHQLVGREQRGQGARADAGEPGPAHAGQEEECGPNRDEECGLADVGLEDQRQDRGRQQAERCEDRRHFRPPAALGEGPGRQHNEGRLHEFGRLHADAQDR
jgi:hypothetical protein